MSGERRHYMLILLAALLSQAGEAPQRERFAKEFKEKDPEKRAEALRSLNAAKETKTVALVIGALKDPSTKVRVAACEVLGTSADPAAAALKPLCGVLTATAEDQAVRLAAARSLMAMPYKTEAIDAMVRTICGITEGQKELYNFGADVTKLLNSTAGQDFGAGKETPAKWKTWWKDNQARVAREDGEKRAARKKESP